MNFAVALLQSGLYMAAVCAAIGACMYPRYALGCVGAFLAGHGFRYLVAYALNLCHF